MNTHKILTVSLALLVMLGLTVLYMTTDVAASLLQSQPRNEEQIPPILYMPDEIISATGMTVTVPIELQNNDAAISGILFSIDYDPECLSFNTADGDEDGRPDGVAIYLPDDFTVSATHDLNDTAGELDIIIADFLPPAAVLYDGLMALLTFEVICQPAAGETILTEVNFSNAPNPSFSSPEGRRVVAHVGSGSIRVYDQMPTGVPTATPITTPTMTSTPTEGPSPTPPSTFTATPTPLVSPTPAPTQTAAPDILLPFAISLQNGLNDVTATNFTITFNDQILEFVEITFDTPPAMQSFIRQTDSTVEVTLTTFANPMPILTDGQFATATFRPRQCQNSLVTADDIQITQFSLGTQNSNNLNPGVIRIEPFASIFCEADTPTPTLTGTSIATPTATLIATSTATPTTTPTAPVATFTNSPTVEPTATSSPTTVLSPTPTATLTPPPSFEFPIILADGQDDISTANFTIEYNSDLLEFVAIDFNTPPAMQTQSNESAGKIEVVFFTFVFPMPTLADGTIGTLVFEPKPCQGQSITTADIQIIEFSLGTTTGSTSTFGTLQIEPFVEIPCENEPPTATVTHTATATLTNTATPTATSTFTETTTATATATATATLTHTPSSTPTQTPTVTPDIATVTPTMTPTITPTATQLVGQQHPINFTPTPSPTVDLKLTPLPTVDPTILVLSEPFSYEITSEGIEFSWQTSLENGITAFRVWRSPTGDRPNAESITTQTIAAIRAEGSHYSLTTPQSDRNIGYWYWLEVIIDDGTGRDIAVLYVPPRHITNIFLPTIHRNSGVGR